MKVEEIRRVVYDDETGKVYEEETLKGIEIPFSEEDLQELLHNEYKTFDWCFNGVDVHICRGEE